MLVKKYHHNNFHQPVLLREVLDVLDPQKDESYLDLTAGYGGHARAVLAKTQSIDRSVLVDRDENALGTLMDLSSQGAQLINLDFAGAAKQLASKGQQFDLILMDLGVSSPHLNNASRGFAFSQNGPLDMRMDRRQKLTAETIVNSASREELTRIITSYGEESRAARIAEAIVAARQIHTTMELANVIERAIGRHGKIHPATKTFQAIRIAVNDELGQLETALPLANDLLAPDGRIAIISFHSLEDRIVKKYFLDQARSGWEAQLKLLTKKPISAAKTELVYNPRARSAKLRAAVKINTQKERG